VEIIRAGGGRPAGVLIALDRMERGLGALSATQEVRSQFGIPVISIATLDDVATFLHARGDNMAQQLQSVERYRREYGVTA
jgi:orotate phosphoribosyltransferase